jgi:hypothetical protein
VAVHQRDSAAALSADCVYVCAPSASEDWVLVLVESGSCCLLVKQKADRDSRAAAAVYSTWYGRWQLQRLFELHISECLVCHA